MVAAGEEERRRLLESRRKPLEKRPKRLVGGAVLELSVSGKPLVEGTPPAHFFYKNRVKTTMQDFHVYRKLTHFLQRITSYCHKAKNLQLHYDFL